MTASTANAGRVMQHLEFVHQWLCPTLDVQLASVSEQWAQFAIAGPRARDTLRRIVDPGFDIGNEAFPFLACSEITVGNGIKARLFRISFSGELAYELAVPARYGDAAWRAVMAYGTEALSVMRIEKGHVAGAEINGQTTARDLGLGGMMAKKKDYIGRLMKERPALVTPDRPILVGVKPVDPEQRLRAGSHFLALDAQPSLDADEGYMTSAAYSPTLGQWIGLGLLRNGATRHGERSRAYDPVRGGDTLCEICPPCFVDPKEEKLRV
jgi:sarcosine oxidase subunit alpha